VGQGDKGEEKTTLREKSPPEPDETSVKTLEQISRSAKRKLENSTRGGETLASEVNPTAQEGEGGRVSCSMLEKEA